MSYIKVKQNNDLTLVEFEKAVLERAIKDLSHVKECVLHSHGYLCVPNTGELRQNILSKDHNSWYSINFRDTNMFHYMWDCIGRMG